MPTNRTPLKRHQRPRLTAAAIAAFVRVEAIRQDVGDEGLLDSRAYLEANRTLRLALGLPPWAFTPAEVEVGDAMPPYLINSDLCSAKTWAPAVELRRELLAAAAATERN